MKHFKFKTVVKITGYRSPSIQGVASTKKQRVTIPQATELITERVIAMVKHSLKQEGVMPESVINSMKFKTTVEVLPVDFIIDLDIPMLKPEVSLEGTATLSSK